MPDQSDAKLLQTIRLLSDAIENNLAALAVVGIKQSDVDEGRAHVAHMEQLDTEQEALKAALKLKTAEITAHRATSKEWQARMIKLIKVAFAKMQEKWVEFGIKAKK